MGFVANMTRKLDVGQVWGLIAASGGGQMHVATPPPEPTHCRELQGSFLRQGGTN
jgi:hypothetical protein